MIAAGIAGLLFLARTAHTGAPARTEDRFPVRLHRGVSIGCLIAFALLVVTLPILATATGDAALSLFDLFYRAGSFVFGGGHVVLPLLQAETVQTGLVEPGAFLAGYGAAQAVPGPLFTYSAFLGAVTTSGPSGALGASIALVAIFLPSALLIIGVLPLWNRLRRAPRVQRALKGVNAGGVGLLAAALYEPVFTEGVTGPHSRNRRSGIRRTDRVEGSRLGGGAGSCWAGGAAVLNHALGRDRSMLRQGPPAMRRRPRSGKLAA